MNRLLGTMIVAVFCGTMLLTTSAQAGDRDHHDRGWDRGHDRGHVVFVDRGCYRPVYAPRYYAPVSAYYYEDYCPAPVVVAPAPVIVEPAPVVVERAYYRPVHRGWGVSVGFYH